MDGRARLRQWLERSHINQREAARILGMHFTHVNQILNGRRSPGLPNAVAIERATGIPVEAWVPTSGGTVARVVALTTRKPKIGKVKTAHVAG